MIPIYRPLSEAEHGIVTHNICALGRFQAVLVGGQGQSDLLNEIRLSLAKSCGKEILAETFEDHFFQNISGYNRLLSEAEFFTRFSDCSYVLICQQDALILRPTLDEWLDQGFAFVGAPMFEGYHAPKRPLQFLRTLNGGLSLRHVPSALAVFRNAVFLRRTLPVRIAQKLGLVKAANGLLSLVGARRLVVYRPGLNEDVFWTGEVAAAIHSFRVPAPEVAARFAFEACPAELFRRTGGQLPFGCHAFSRYDPKFWIDHVPAELVPYLVALKKSAAE